MAYPTLTEKAQKVFDDAVGKYSICIMMGEFGPALKIVKDLYDKMLDWQSKYNLRFHKGYPIHNIGYTLFLQKEYLEARRYFILAYIEDLLSADEEEEADSTPAGQTLLLGYSFGPELLNILKRKVKELKEEGRIPLRPEEVVQELQASKPDYKDVEGKVAVIKKEAPLKPFTVFEKEWEKRVFVGGTIGLRFIIEKVADIVSELDYEPIVCHQVVTPQEMERDIRSKCLVLLHCCKYAIFDLAEQKGQLVEIDRAPEYGVLTLVVWPDTKEKEVTEMLKSLVNRQQINSNSYKKFPEDVKTIVQEFLEAQ